MKLFGKWRKETEPRVEFPPFGAEDPAKAAFGNPGAPIAASPAWLLEL